MWVIVGDSFSDPRHSGYAEFGVKAWPALVEQKLGVRMLNYASSGDGYAHRRQVTFSEQAAAAARDASAGKIDPHAVTRVIVYGGINDYASGTPVESVQAAAAETARSLAAAFPAALIEGYMNWYPHALDDLARTYVGAIAVGLGQGGMSLRTDSMWILENATVSDAYLVDNLHPNQLGHTLMADFFMNARGNL